ncbi:MAG: Gfo/Idh/MocA family oxidoreductase [Candidatus Thorarchaeota archaeon]
MAQLKVGLIGAGAIGEVHLEGFKRNKNCALMAIASRTEEHAENFVEEHKIYNYKKIQRPVILMKIIRAISSIMAFIFSKIFVVFSGWNCCPAKDWEKIKAKKLILFLKNDSLIPYDVSFFNSVKKTEKQFIRILDPDCHHWKALSSDIVNEALQTLEA